MQKNFFLASKKSELYWKVMNYVANLVSEFHGVNIEA